MKQKSSKNSLFQILEFCPNCAGRYNGVKANLIKHKKGLMMVHVTCPRCESSVISSISLNNTGMMAVGMMTDLTKEDLRLLRDNRPISVDDVIDVHEIVEKAGSINFKDK